jgi:signal peptidase I
MIKRTLHTIHQYLWKTVSIVLQTTLIIGLLYFFIASPNQVNGASMLNTLKDEQKYLNSTVSYLFSTPKRLEVVLAIDPITKNKNIIKRIIGLPGETISFKHGKIIITNANGKQETLQEPYLKKNMLTSLQYGQNNNITIPKNSYFLLGDNRMLSTDSRTYGPVHRNLIVGKAIIKKEL